MLVGPDNVCKIANFSIAQDPDSDEEFLPEANRFAVKWSAPEVVSRAQFSTPGDVWSYGILLTELVTYGRAPYPGMNNAEVLQQVERGYRMPSPPGTPEPLYQIMLDCWKANAEERPTFETLQWRLEDFFVNTENNYTEASTFE